MLLLVLSPVLLMDMVLLSISIRHHRSGYSCLHTIVLTRFAVIFIPITSAIMAFATTAFFTWESD